MAPLTSEIGFFEAPVDEVADAFDAWQRRIKVGWIRRRRLSRRAVTGDLRNVLRSLEPLTTIEHRRCVFVPTESGWTAYFDNGHQGADAGPVLHVLGGRLACRTVRVRAQPHTYRQGRGRYGALILRVGGRVISLVNDGGSWDFETSGEPLPFERLDRYEATSKGDRFTLEMLREYLRELGIRALDPGFYTEPAWQFDRRNLPPPASQEISLHEVRRTLDG